MQYPRQSSPRASSKKTKRNHALDTIYNNEGEGRDLKTIDRHKGGSRGLTLVLLFVLIAMGIGAFASSKPGLKLGGGKLKNEATLAIEAPKDTAILSPYTLKLVLDPGNARIKEGTLSLFLPNGFVMRESAPEPTASPGKKEKQWAVTKENAQTPIVIRGMFLGNVNEEQSFRAVLNYKPENFGSEFQANALHTARLKNSPVQFTVEAPERVYGGEEKEYIVRIKNTSSEKLTDLIIQPPAGAAFSLTDPDTNAVLAIKDLDKNTELSRILHGAFAADMQGTGNLTWALRMTTDGETYTIASAIHTIAVNQQPILLSINLDENTAVLRPGDVIKGEVRYQNKTTEPLKDVTVKLTIEAPAKKRESVLDWTRLDTTGSPKVEGVQINDTARSGVITWTPDLIPLLKTVAAGQAGVLSFSVPVKSSGVFDVTGIGAADIRLSADVTTGEQALSAQPISLPLVADTSVQAGAVKAGDTVVMQWTVNHHFHTVKDGKVSARLFGNIGWLDQSDTSDGDITYDSISRTVSWNLPKLEPTAGVLTASFAVRVEKPDPTQTTLMDETTLTGTDEIASRPISRTVPAVKMPR